MRTSLDNIGRPAKPDGLEYPPAALASRKSIVNRTLTRIADNLDHRGADWLCGFCGPQCTQDEARMQRLRLKADGRIVELRDGQEFPLAPVMAVPPSATVSDVVTSPAVRDLRRR